MVTIPRNADSAYMAHETDSERALAKRARMRQEREARAAQRKADALVNVLLAAAFVALAATIRLMGV